MIKSIIVGIICLIIFTSFTEVFGQEENSITSEKNLKEWHAIGVALISENRYEEAIKYYDKILEVNPDHVKALSNKGISLAWLQEWSEAEELIFRAVELEPENKLAQSTMYQFLSGIPLVSDRDSIYDISTRITIRDSSGNLISVSESSNSRYLPYPLTDRIFEKHVIEEGVIIDGKVYDIAQNVDTFVPNDNASGAFSISHSKYGHPIDVFFSFVPMIFHEMDDSILTEWRIVKEVT